MPKDKFYRERERRIRSAIHSYRLLWEKYVPIGSESVLLKSLQREIGPRRLECRCGREIHVTVEQQKERRIVSCPECGKRYRASLGPIKPI
jgi:hypothetical protein